MAWKNKTKEEIRAYYKTWYLKNKVKRIKYIKQAEKKRCREYKQRLILYLGGCCKECGYNKCSDALEFHHKSRSEKEFTIGEKLFKYSFDRLKKEVEKCDLLCANCHREIEFLFRRSKEENAIDAEVEEAIVL